MRRPVIAIAAAALVSLAVAAPTYAHSSFYPHDHVVDRVTSTYTGYYYYSTQVACVGPCTISATVTRATAHKWGTSIAFAAPPVTATVGYDVTWTHSYSYTVSFTNSTRGVAKTIKYHDKYTVSNLNVRTVWYLWGEDGGKIYTGTDYGTGWAAKFLLRTYYLQ